MDDISDAETLEDTCYSSKENLDDPPLPFTAFQDAVEPQATENNEDHPTLSRKKNPVVMHLDNISICGLHNFLYAESKLERRVWGLILILGTAGTLFYFIPAVIVYLRSPTVLEIQHVTEPKMRLPHMWVCAFGVNYSYL